VHAFKLNYSLVVNGVCSILDLQAAFGHKILLVRDVNI